MFKRLFGAAVIFGAAALAPPVSAQSAQTATCLPRDLITDTLSSTYGERLTGGGLQTASQLLEIWSSDSGSFTLLMTRADGISCVIATGQNWHGPAPAIIRDTPS